MVLFYVFKFTNSIAFNAMAFFVSYYTVNIYYRVVKNMRNGDKEKHVILRYFNSNNIIWIDTTTERVTSHNFDVINSFFYKAINDLFE